MPKITLKHQLTEFLLYNSPNWEIKVEVFLHEESLWLNQKSIAELFWVQQPAIAKHLKNIFESWELEENSVCSILEYTGEDNNYKILNWNWKINYEKSDKKLINSGINSACSLVLRNIK